MKDKYYHWLSHDEMGEVYYATGNLWQMLFAKIKGISRKIGRMTER